MLSVYEHQAYNYADEAIDKIYIIMCEYIRQRLTVV